MANKSLFPPRRAVPGAEFLGAWKLIHADLGEHRSANIRGY